MGSVFQGLQLSGAEPSGGVAGLLDIAVGLVPCVGYVSELLYCMGFGSLSLL